VSAAATVCGAAVANAVPVTVRTAVMAGTMPLGAAVASTAAATGCEDVR
jgi:hypothetical protein